LDQGKHKTQASFPNKPNGTVVRRGQCSSVQPQLSASLSRDPTACYFYYFEIFVQRNIFTPNVALYNRDIQRLLGTGSGQFLHHAVLALGALQSSRIGAESRANRKEYEYAALEAYSTSLTALRDTMANCPSPPRLMVFWTTLFLGIFELMQGKTGDGWLMHMVHGTASALQAAGPLACQSGLGLAFFHQARIFEASRALLLGERSFLSNPEWDRFTRNLSRVDGLVQRSRLDDILNVIVQCSKLRAQVVQMLARVDPSHVSQVPNHAPSIANEGFRLRQMLEAWRTENPAPQAQALTIPYTSSVFGSSLEDLISNIFLVAISIYLSGIFDYEIIHWQRWGILVPTITEMEVQEHLGDLLSLTIVALSSISGYKRKETADMPSCNATKHQDRPCTYHPMKASMLVAALLPGTLADFYIYYQRYSSKTNGALETLVIFDGPPDSKGMRHALVFNWRHDARHPLQGLAFGLHQRRLRLRRFESC
ncbi:hypothetical protein PG997_014932, partial [Apiospora hydei]